MKELGFTYVIYKIEGNYVSTIIENTLGIYYRDPFTVAYHCIVRVVFGDILNAPGCNHLRQICESDFPFGGFSQPHQTKVYVRFLN